MRSVIAAQGRRRLAVRQSAAAADVHARRDNRRQPLADILVWINTYNRVEALRLLLSDIARERGELAVHVLVVDDCSTADYAEVFAAAGRELVLRVFRMPAHGGKRLYWRTCTQGMQLIRQCCDDYRYFVKLDDDLRLCPQFFTRCIAIWNAIDDRRKAALNFRVDHRIDKRGWTDRHPHLVTDWRWPVYRTQWVDMDFFATRGFFDALNFTVRPIDAARWRQSATISSGVGQQLSWRLVRSGWNLYMTSQSLVRHGDCVSLMNPVERRRVTLETINHADDRYGLCVIQ